MFVLCLGETAIHYRVMQIKSQKKEKIEGRERVRGGKQF